MTNDKSKKIGDYTKTPKSKELFTLMIENLFCLIFGKKAYYGTASAFGNPAYFKRHIIKLVDKFIAEIAELHASEKFIDYLNYQLGYLKKEILSAGDLSNETKGILIVNLKIVATLLGHAQASGDRREEPYFIPSLWAEMQGWIDLGQYLNTKEYLTKQKRLDLVGQLVEEGKTLSEIALIMNLSSYKIAQFSQQLRARKQK